MTEPQKDTQRALAAAKRPGEKMDREESARMMRMHAKPIVGS